MLEMNRRYLPWSGRRYYVDQFGKIYDSSDNLVKSYKVDGELFVDLEWALGKKPYQAALVILVAFSRIDLPEHLIEEVKPLYVDGDSENLFPTNLIYRFKNGPLEVEGYPNFYYVPFFNKYAISRNGKIVNIKTGEFKVWSETKSNPAKNSKGGYRYGQFVSDTGASGTLFQHRALCMVFKLYEGDLFSIVVNHLDGNPRNNELDNLEWTTYRENNIHAVTTGLRLNQAIPILMKNLSTGEILRFPSIGLCAAHLGHPRSDLVKRRLENSSNKVYTDMLAFKYDDGREWPAFDPDAIANIAGGYQSDIIARNVFTGKFIVFSGTYQGEELTGVKNFTIADHLRTNQVIPVNGYNFRYLEFSGDWPVHTKRHLEIYEKHPVYPTNGVICTDIETKEETFYTSSSEFCKKHGIKSSYLSILISKKIKWKYRYQLSYFKLKESLGPTVA